MKYDKDFWKAIDTLVSSGKIIIDRPKGSVHPKFPDVKYEVDYVTGKMYCTVDSIGLESDKSGNLCDPYEGYGWIGSQHEDDKVLAYLSGRDSFVLELTEEGVVTCNDFVEFDAQYIKS